MFFFATTPAPWLRTLLIYLTFISVNAFGTFAHSGETWQVGVATQIITPTEPMWMAGYGSRNAPSHGKLSELYAKALILKPESGETAIVLTLDLVGIDRTLSHKVRTAIGKELDIKPDNVLIATSHTHSGPVVGKNLATLHYYQVAENFQKQIDQYEHALLANCVSVAKAAQGSMQACLLTHGQSTTDFATNRRANKEPDVPTLRAAGKLAGPFDHDVPVLAARNNDGKLIAVLFGYACHSTVLSDYVWSADYPGYAQAHLEAQHPGAVALFWAGCGADQNPLPRRSPELAKHYGQRLAIAVDRVLMTTKMEPIPSQLSCNYKEVAAPLDTLPTKEALEKQAQSSDKYEAVRAKLELEQIAQGQPLSPTYPYPISLWNIGGKVKFVALGGEVVVDYALRTKADLGGQVWVAGYAHDVMAYIPSRRVLTEGGYEGGGAMLYYGLPCHWGPGIEEVIMQGIKQLWSAEAQPPL